MNIKQAKEQIKNALTAYFTKDEFGCCRIPVERQRPIFLLGPPGVGKTAVMEQIAGELGVGLVSYSMTHHTRQSALGLPFIVKEEFEGKRYEMSEYTMSEIIGSIYRLMRETGIREGILFLDEINCVSETLAPSMLQFLQYKTFGQHRVPDGWIVVTAGNPPEYNKSVRDFDIVTWDRLKRIDVEPDYEAWKEYAGQKGVHAAVTTYLSAKKRDFYLIESTVEGKQFVTARGWEDLSEMIVLYEANGLAVDEALIGQYLQHRRVAKDFALYYDLYRKYRSDYRIDAILAGVYPPDILARAGQAGFDERLSLLGLLLDAVAGETGRVMEEEDVLRLVLDELKAVRRESAGAAVENALAGRAARLREELERGRASSSLSAAKQRRIRRAAAALDEYRAQAAQAEGRDAGGAWSAVKDAFDRKVSGMKGQAETAGRRLEHVFEFCEEAFGEGQELLLLVTELTARRDTARFIGRYGCRKYDEHAQSLQFDQRQRELDRRVADLNL